MKKRLLSVCLSVAILLGALAATGVLPAMAVSEGFTAGTVGQYKAWAQSTQLKTIMGDATNLILGKTAYGSAYNSAACGDNDTTLSNWYHETDETHHCKYPGYAGGATDGLIGSHSNRATTEEIFRSNNTSTLRYFYYDLGAVYNASDFIVASSQCNLDAANRVLKYIDVYVAEEWNETASFTTHKGAFTEGNFTQVFGWNDSASETFIHQIQPTDGETVAARYVCFVFKAPVAPNGSAAPIPINELAVYGTLPGQGGDDTSSDVSDDTSDDGNEFTVTWVNGDNGAGRYGAFPQYNNAYLASLGTSLVKDVIPYYGTGTSLWSSSSYQSSEANGAVRLTDGVIRTSKEDTSTDKFTSTHRGANTIRYFTFDLGAKYDLTDFVAASSQNDSGENLLRWVKIWVGDNLETLYTDADNLVYSRWDQDVDATNRNFHIQPTDGKAVTGQYVCFELQTPANALFRIEELAVYGTKAAVPPKQPDADGVIAWENGDAIDTENNLLNGASADTNCNAYVSNAYKDNSGYNGWSTVMANITDGNASTAGVLYSWAHEDGYAEIKVGDTTLTGTSGMASMAFNLGGTYSIEKLLVIGNSAGSTNAVWSYASADSAKQYWGEGGYALKESDGRYHPIYADGTFRTFNDKILQYYEVYISTSAATLFDEANRVWTYTNKNQYQGTTYALPTAVTGSYIGYRFTTGSGGSAQGRVGELGVYGTAVEDIKIVTVGDSITHGANQVEGRYFKNYPAMLAYLLNADTDKAKPYSVYNAGISGSTVVNYQLVDETATSDASWKTLGTAAGHVRYADILTIMLGTNDANSWSSRKSLYKEEYKKIVDAFKALNPNVKVYIATSPYTSTFSEATLTEISTMQKELATELNATLIDVYTATADRVAEKGESSLFKSADMLHPHEKGQAFLSTLFYKAITGKDAGLDLDAEEENTATWKEGALTTSDSVPAGNLLQSATVDTTISSNANGKWLVAFESLVNEDNTDVASIYAKTYETGYPEVIHPVTGAAIAGTTGWAQMMFKLDDYYAIDRLLFYGYSSANPASKWSYQSEDSAKKYWGENYTLHTDGRYYCAYADGTIRAFNDRNPQYIEVYVSEFPGMLFNEDSLVWSYDNTTAQNLGYGITLPEAVKGQYVGVRVTTGSTFQARLGEVAIYGEATQREYTGTQFWNVGDALPENNLLSDAARQRDDALGNQLASNLGPGAPDNAKDGSAENKACYYNFDEDNTKYFPEVKNPATGEVIVGTSGWARIAFKLQKYSAIEKIMVLGSVKDQQITQWGYEAESAARQNFSDNYVQHTDGKYYASYADGTIRGFNNRQVLYYEVYVADNFNSLFDADNLVYSFDNTKIMVDGAIHELDEPVEGQFVGYRVTSGTNNQARVGELGVYGYTVDKDITLTADTTLGEISYTISANNTPDRDALQQVVGSLKVTIEKLDGSIATNIDNNWLTVDGTAVYHVQLLDKNGNVFPDVSADPAGGLNGRPVQISIPTSAGYMQTLGTLKSGVIQRVFNSQKTLDGHVLAGTLEYPDYGTSVPNNREKAVISTSDLRLVMLKFNDLDTINKLNGAVVNTPLSEFEPDDVAGATGQRTDVLPIVVVSVAVLCAASVAIVLVWRRRRVQL